MTSVWLVGEGGDDAEARARGERRTGRGRGGDELSVEIALDAAAPGADEGEIESAADGGAGERDEAGDPFFRGFGTDADSEFFNNDGRELFGESFFGEVLAEIDASSSGSGEPELALLLVIAEVETIKQAEALNQAKRDDGKEACVGDDGDHAAEAEARSFEEGEALRIANQNPGDGVQTVYGHVAKVAEVGNVDAVLPRQVATKGFAIDFDRAEAAFEAKAQQTREWSSEAHRI